MHSLSARPKKKHTIFLKRTKPMVAILRKLRAEHDDLTRVLDVLEQEVKSYERRGRINRDIVGDVLDYCRGYPALCHHPKEDLIYRKLRLAAEPAAMDTVGDLLVEHETLAALTDQLQADMKDAMRSGDTERRDTLRMVVSAAQSAAKDKREPLSDEEALAVVTTSIEAEDTMST